MWLPHKGNEFTDPLRFCGRFEVDEVDVAKSLTKFARLGHPKKIIKRICGGGEVYAIVCTKLTLERFGVHFAKEF